MVQHFLSPQRFSTMSNLTTFTGKPDLVEIAMLSTLTTLTCCVFLFINGTMLFTLRSKSVFCETSRYVLLYNLLFADSVQLALSQLFYIFGAYGFTMSFPACVFLTMLNELIVRISPLALVAMSLERYVAVCYPLRHASIVTMRKTNVAICGIWGLSFFNVFFRIIILAETNGGLPNFQMKRYCSKESTMYTSLSALYDNVYNWILFVSAGVSVIFSYIGVIVAARSAASDNVAAFNKIRKTLLLHLVQLALSLSSVAVSPLLIAIFKVTEMFVFLRIQIVFYVCVGIFPRCLSSLIYGISDPVIRPVLMYYLFCQLRVKPV